MPRNAVRSFRSDFAADCARAWPGKSRVRLAWNVLVDSGLRSTLYLRVQILLQNTGATPLARLVSRLNLTRHALDVVAGAQIGPGLLIRHPAGIVIGSNVVVGSNVTIMQNVTLGQRDLSGGAADDGNPIIEDGSTIGCGAVVLGPVRIGERATVGASALVISDVPAGSTVVGVPARMINTRRMQE